MIFKDNIRNSALVKMLLVFILALLLLIPAAMIQDLISERAQRKTEAMKEVSEKWGEKQVFAGPILMIPYTETNKITTKDENGKTVVQENKTNSYIKILPEKLNFDGQVDTELLKRGIYKTVVYNSKINVSGNFSSSDISSLDLSRSNVEVYIDRASVIVSLSDLRALQSNPDFSWNGKEYDFKPGYRDQDAEAVLGGSVLHVEIPVEIREKRDYSFSFTYDVNGSDGIYFLPLGKETNVDLTSNWPSPSFDGVFLPDEREISKTGFKAKWNILELNRNYPQVWEGSSKYNLEASSFGSRLIVAVDEYQKNTRSVKYAIMFIALTFLVFFFVEMLNQIKIHPIQYILVGLSLVLFFSLLLSITEHLNFNKAYLISAVGTVGLVTLYTKTIFKNIRLTLVQSGILAAIYIFIYTIIQMEDYSLLFGSIGLFVVLAIVMYVSRKIDWYSVGARKLGDMDTKE